jgi:hypothetical protein
MKVDNAKWVQDYPKQLETFDCSPNTSFRTRVLSSVPPSRDAVRDLLGRRTSDLRDNDRSHGDGKSTQLVTKTVMGVLAPLTPPV